MRTCVIANPAAGQGRVRRLWPALHSALSAAVPDLTCRWTASPGEGTPLTRQALRDGFHRIVAIGGDGTFNEVVNGFFGEDGTALAPSACLVPLPCGTGTDFRRALDLPVALDAVALMRRERVRPVDLLRVTYAAHDGTRRHHYALNIVSFGLSSRVAQYVNEGRVSLPGPTLRYLGPILRTLFTHRPVLVSLTLDDTPLPSGPVQLVAVANGPFFGAGIQIAPSAEVDDAQLDVTVLHDVPLWRLLWHARRFYQGTHLSLRGVSTHRGRRLTAHAPDGSPVVLEADGELLGRLPATIEVIPEALRLQC
jgi:YegS/Rv2252/BmrU family lipid kinase